MKLTRTGKIIFAVVIVVLSAALGYLIWRINNESNLGPDDSQAGGGAGSCCIPSVGCVAGHKCDTSQTCTQEEKAYVGGYGPACGKNTSGQNVNCRSSFTCVDSSTGVNKCKPGSGLGVCVAETDPGGPGEGECKDVKCEWPKTLMSGRQTADQEVCRCELCDGTNGCNGNPPTCSPGACPSGTVSCGDSTNHESGSDCTKRDSISCTVYHADCNNPSVIYRYCKPIPSNVCDKGGSWKTKPAASIKHGDNVTFSATATDSDGIDTSSVKVTKNGTAMSKCTGSTVTDCYTVSESGTTATISGTLASPDSGNYTIAMDWKDKKGAGGTDCALSTAFAVQVPETNPDWDITKSVVEQCIDENTENPKSQLTYAITVKNTGDGSGSFTKIEDVLDSKVLDSFVQTSSITGGGVYSSGKIIWDFSSNPVSVAAGESKSYTYTLVVDKGHFDTYANTVTLTPAGSDSISANANITADCEISEPPIVPQTGIFDNAAVRIIAGIILLTFGVIVYRIPSMSLSIYIRNGKMYIRDKNISKIRERFEKRVANS